MRVLNQRLLLAWIVALPISVFTVGFLSNFYSTLLELVLISTLSQLAAGTFLYLMLGRINNIQRMDFLLALGLFAVLAAFAAYLFKMALQFPSLFAAGYFLMETFQIYVFTLGALLAVPAMAWGLSFSRTRELKRSGLYQLVASNLPGLFLAGFFFAAYLISSSIFNQPAFDVDDIFFDSDGLLWRRRFVTADYQDYYWRAVHPFVLLIIRPLVALIGFLLKGDRLSAAFLLVAFAGAACVYIAWYFVKSSVGNSVYGLLIASLLGASAAHLVFGSLLETYIFLAAVTMTFLVLLLKDKTLVVLIVAGLVSFGITITNFIQTAILFIFVKWHFKAWVKYGIAVAALTIPLTLLNNVVYPNSQPYFFVPASFSAEADNTFAPSIQRGLAIARVMALHSIVAPDPLMLEEEIPFLKVWIFKADPLRLSEYETWFGATLSFIWVGLLLLGAALFLKSIRTADHRYLFAFIAIVLFNFALHLRYGKDIFLYSTNWTYAIVLFLALAWKDFASKRWFQIGLLIFIALLLANNSRLIYTMLSTTALHIK